MTDRSDANASSERSDQDQKSSSGTSQEQQQTRTFGAEDLEAILDRRFKELEDGISRRVSQSVKDSTEYSIKRAVRERMAEIEETLDTMGLDAATKDKLMQQNEQRIKEEEANKRIETLEKTLSEDKSVDTDQNTQSQQNKSLTQEQIRDNADKVQKANSDLAKQYGFWFLPDDPEQDLVTVNPYEDPDGHIAQVKLAIEAKAARMSGRQQVSSPAPRNPSLSDQEVGGSGDLYQEYLKKAEKMRPGSEEVLQLRREYRRKGVRELQ